MTRDELRKVAQSIMLLAEAGAPGDEHERVKVKLYAWAASLDFAEVLSTLDGKQPDVLRRRDNSYLFVGEAKNAEHETATNDASVWRLGNYIWSFSEALKGGQIDGGLLAVATNTPEAAEGWAAVLAVAARLAKMHRADGQVPRVVDLGDRTWVAWW